MKIRVSKSLFSRASLSFSVYCRSAGDVAVKPYSYGWKKMKFLSLRIALTKAVEKYWQGSGYVRIVDHLRWRAIVFDGFGSGGCRNQRSLTIWRSVFNPVVRIVRWSFAPENNRQLFMTRVRCDVLVGVWGEKNELQVCYCDFMSSFIAPPSKLKVTFMNRFSLFVENFPI